MAERVIPISRIRIYNVGSEGYCTDPGWAWYSPLSVDLTGDEAVWSIPSAYEWGATGSPPSVPAFQSIQLGKRTSVIPRFSVNRWDMDLDDWTESGSWSELQAIDAPVVFAYNANPSGSLTADFSHPEGPNVVLAVQPLAVGADADITNTPPQWTFGWGPSSPGAGEYRYELRVNADGRAELWQIGTGGTASVLGAVDIGWKWPQIGEEAHALQLAILHLSDGIVLHNVEAGTWQFISADDPIWPTSGTFVFSHSGSRMYFALWGVLGPVPSVGSTNTQHTLTSAEIDTDRTRSTNPTVETWDNVPSVSSPDVAPNISASAIDHTGTAKAQCEVDVTWGYKDVSGTTNTYRFTYLPELYAVQMYWDPTIQSANLAYSTEYANQIAEARVELPDENSVSRARIRLYWNTNEYGAFADWLYMRFIDLALGWKHDDDSETLTVVFTGYVAENDVVQEQPNVVIANLGAVDPTVRLRSHECDDTWPVMDGWTSQDAVTYILKRCGWDPTRADATALTDTLSEGIAEQPLWRPQPGQSPWDFLEKVARYNGCEWAVNADGTITARSIATWTATMHNIAATSMLSPAVDIRRRNAWQYTGVIVVGRTTNGKKLTSIQSNADAESNPAAANFRGFRRLERIEDYAFTTQSKCDALATTFYNSLVYRMGDIAKWRTVGYETAVRRDKANISGLSISLTTSTWGIVALTHYWSARKPGCYTEWEAVPIT